jgi:polysaccharide biosynthesis protein PslH
MPAKRILILTNRVPHPLNDGGNLAMHAMIEGYRMQGWEVFLLAMNTSRHYITPDVLKTIYTGITAFETVDIDNSVKPVATIANYLFSTKPNHASRFFQKTFAGKLEEVIKQFSPNVIQFESVFLSSYLPLVKKLTHAITVLRLHNIEYQVWQRLAMETRGTIKKIYLSNLGQRIEQYEKEVWAHYDLLLPITDADAAFVRQSGVQAAMLTIPFGIDIKSVYGSTSANWSVYHIGAMDWIPNQEAVKWFLQEVWPLLHQKIPQASFYYAGRNMPQHFKELDIAGAHCMGEVPDAQTFIADKKILIVPIQAGGGIRIKILEAMAEAKVIVSTSIGMQGIDVQDGVHYLRADTAIEFVDKLSWIYDNKEKAEAMALAAQAIVRDKYDSHQLMQMLDNKLSGILNTLM